MNTLNTNDILVVTIVIQMHGTVITYDLTPEIANTFDNVRLLCKAGGLKEYVSGQTGLPGITEEFMLVTNLREIFGKDINETTYNIIKDARTGILIGNITFDKTLSRSSGSNWDYTNLLQGIYLLSIHKGKKIIYPKPNEKVINLLKIRDLERLAYFFNSKVPKLEDVSIPFPNQEIYIEEENIVNNDKKLSNVEKEEKIEEIRQQFMRLLYKWDLTLDKNGNIEEIKLSYLVKLVKEILGDQIVVNLLDYSCNAPTSFISKKQSSQYAMDQQYDIERGFSNSEYGGRKRKKNKIKKTKKRYTRKRHTKKRKNKKK